MPHHCLPQVLPCPLEIRERCFFHIPQALCQKPKSSPYIEIFLDRQDHQIRIGWPKVGQRRSKARYLLSPFFRDDEILAGDPLDRLPAMQRAIDASHAAVRRKIRISTELSVWLEMLDRREQQIRSRQHFETEAASGKVSDTDCLWAMQKARSTALTLPLKKHGIGVAHHQVDVFIMEPGSSRYLGRLCTYNQCPKGKPECQVPGCGSTQLLRQHEDFQLNAAALLPGRSFILE